MFIIIWNFITFVLMGWDKHQAKARKRRISEKTLLLCAFLMGGAGIGAGMLCFCHKTRKWKFRLLVPAGIVVNYMVIWVIIRAMDVFFS